MTGPPTARPGYAEFANTLDGIHRSAPTPRQLRARGEFGGGGAGRTLSEGLRQPVVGEEERSHTGGKRDRPRPRRGVHWAAQVAEYEGPTGSTETRAPKDEGHWSRSEDADTFEPFVFDPTLEVEASRKRATHNTLPEPARKKGRRRGGRRKAHAAGYQQSDARQRYEVGLVIEAMVREVELAAARDPPRPPWLVARIGPEIIETLIDAQFDLFLQASWLLPSLPSQPGPGICACRCCTELPAGTPVWMGCSMKFSARDTSKLRKKRAGVWGCCRVYEGGGKGIYGGGYQDFRHRVGDIEKQEKEPATQNAFPAAARAAAAARATTRAAAAVEDGTFTMAATMDGPSAEDDAIAVAIAAAGALARAAGINAGIAATLDGADATIILSILLTC